MHQKVQIKLFCQPNAAPDDEPFMGVFQRWIRDGVFGDELLIDAADYAHVPDGPGTVLIGQRFDFFYDHGDGKPGMLVSFKRGEVSNVQEALSAALEKALRACSLLEEESAFATKPAFARDQVWLRFPDRLRVQNEDAWAERLAPAAMAALEKTFGEAGWSWTRVSKEKQPLTMLAKRAG